MPVIFTENFTKTYYTSLFSQSSIFCITLVAIAILLPFFAAFATDEFWVKLSTYTEQPIIEFDGQFILHVLDRDESYYYSSISKLNELNDNVLANPVVEVDIVNIVYDY